MKLRLHADRLRWQSDEDLVLKLDVTLAADAVNVQTADPTYGWLLTSFINLHNRTVAAERITREHLLRLECRLAEFSARFP